LAKGSIATVGRVGPIGPAFATNDLSYVVRADKAAVAEARNLSAALGPVDEVDRSPSRRDGWFVQDAREDALCKAERDRRDRWRRAVRTTNKDLIRA
jgi:hypothetical protein